MLSAGVLSLSVAGTALASDYHSPFTDLSPNSWCYGYVTSMVGHNFLSGYPDNTFRQDALITRAETATALSKLGLPAIIVSKEFYDVQSLTWYHDAIQKAYTSGVMLATNHDTTSDYYAPNDYLTRAVRLSLLLAFMDCIIPVSACGSSPTAMRFRMVLKSISKILSMQESCPAILTERCVPISRLPELSSAVSLISSAA